MQELRATKTYVEYVKINAVVRRYTDGSEKKAEMQRGDEGFLTSCFPGEKPQQTEIPNVLSSLDMFKKPAAVIKRPAGIIKNPA